MNERKIVDIDVGEMDPKSAQRFVEDYVRMVMAHRELHVADPEFADELGLDVDVPESL